MSQRWRTALLAGAVSAQMVPIQLIAAQPKHIVPLHYHLVMSKDNALCRPLVNFYNAHVAARDNESDGYIEDQFGGDLRPPGPVFLLAGPTWEWYHEVFPEIKIYNNALRYHVVINDFGINWKFVTFQSQLLIMKRSYHHTSEAFFERPLYMNEDVPQLKGWVDFSHGGSSVHAPHQLTYPLRELPGFDVLIARIRARERVFPVPLMYQSVAQRLVRFRSRIYVSARTRGHWPGTFTLIYDLKQNNVIHDDCYFEIDTTKNH